MKQGLSKREKLLFFVLILIALFYFSFQFGFLPLVERYQAGIIERGRLAYEKAEAEVNIAHKHVFIENNRIASELFESAKVDYPLLITTEEIDNILTNLVVKNRLAPSGLHMTVVADSNKNLAPPEEGEEPPPLPIFTTVTATMPVIGPYSNLMNLMDDVDKISNIRLANVTYLLRIFEEDENIIESGSIALNFELLYLNR
jgi:hypothetical protein